MLNIKVEKKAHPSDIELADYLAGELTAPQKEIVEEHISCCGECLARIVSAYESVNSFKKNGTQNKRKAGSIMKKINLYLVFAIIAFALSFFMPRFFLQFLLATLLLGIKWIVDSKSMKMLIMIHEAWKRGGEKETSRILKTFDQEKNRRF